MKPTEVKPTEPEKPIKPEEEKPIDIKPTEPVKPTEEKPTEVKPTEPVQPTKLGEEKPINVKPVEQTSASDDKQPLKTKKSLPETGDVSLLGMGIVSLYGAVKMKKKNRKK